MQIQCRSVRLGPMGDFNVNLNLPLLEQRDIETNFEVRSLRLQSARYLLVLNELVAELVYEMPYSKEIIVHGCSV
jgi:hypothetical protein